MIICFSRIVDNNVKRQYPSKVPLGGADDNFNRRIINGIEQNNYAPILINYMPYHSFPSGRFLLYKREETVSGKRRTINVSYINLPIIKSVVTKWAIVHEVKKLVDRDQRVNILIYDSYPAFINAALTLKRWNQNIKTTLITPTVPTFDVPRKDLKTRISRRFQKTLLNKDKEMDSYVFLTEQMNEILNPERKKKYTVVEGVIPNEKEEINATLDAELINKKYALYSGRLDKVYSIDKLVEAFESLQEDIYLVLCGIGDYADEITKKATENPHIIYLGFKNRPELNTIQRNATMLINPRSPQGVYTRYSFPSKTMEYLLTGKPVIMHRLPGIPAEYDEYLYYINDDSANAIKNAVLTVSKLIDDGSAGNKAKDARSFVKNYKNEKVQAQKVIHLMENLWRE